MSKIRGLANVLQWVLLILLTGAAFGFILFANLYGVFLALVTSFIVCGIYKNKRWGYFSAAVWGLGCYQLAKQGYEFQAVKHVVMSLGIAVVPVALFLHEMLGKPRNVHAQKSVTNLAKDDHVPQ